MQIDQDKLSQFLGQVVGELGAAMNAALVLIGEKLGLYKAMAGAGPISPAELAHKTGTDERYVREWLSALAAGGYVTYEAATQTFKLPEEQAFALAVETGEDAVSTLYRLPRFGSLRGLRYASSACRNPRNVRVEPC